jgi:predicted DNA-binding transcriptional regulator AlpA
MSVRKIPETLSVLAGLLIASTVWAINMQLGQILPYTDCARQSRWSAIISLIGVAVAIFASAISWRWTKQGQIPAPLTATSRFVAWLSALSALIFAFALSMQGIASLVLSGCER